MTLRILTKGRWVVLVDAVPIETRWGLCLEDDEQLVPLRDAERVDLVPEQLVLTSVQTRRAA